MDKIKFIVVGWHYHQMEFYEGLNDLKNSNENVSVFWACHKEPTDYVKENFEYEVFPNIGEEFIAYQQAVEYLDLEEDIICFFVHDDIIIKDWEFISLCVDKLNQGYKFLGNCFNYPMPEFDPTKVHVDGIGITEDFDDKPISEYALDETKHLFDRNLAPVLVVRGSFICCRYKHLKEIHGFEPRKEAWIGLTWDEDLQTHSYRGGVGQGRFGNLFMFMFSYKINRIFGKESITYLSNRYLDSDYIYEMGRGKIDERNPMT